MMRAGKKSMWRHLVATMFAAGVLAGGFTLQAGGTGRTAGTQNAIGKQSTQPRKIVQITEPNRSTAPSTITLGGALPDRLDVPILDPVIVDSRDGGGIINAVGTVSAVAALGDACRFDAQCNDCNPCTIDSCDDEVCVGGNRDGFACEIDNDCEGLCGGGVKNGLLCRDDLDCCGDGDTIVDGVCNFQPCVAFTTGGAEGTGGNQCVNALIPEFACDSGNREGQLCDPNVDPTNLTNGCPGTAANPDAGKCKPRFEQGAECDDGISCNGRETCDSTTSTCMAGQTNDAIFVTVFQCDAGNNIGLACNPNGDPALECPPGFLEGDCVATPVACEDAGLICKEASQACILPCLFDSECPNDDSACTVEVCNPKLCEGGPTPGAGCRADDGCGIGGTCSGGGDGSCSIENPCGGGGCINGSVCVGGGLDGEPCTTAADCDDGAAGGSCPTVVFSCLPGRCCAGGACQRLSFADCASGGGTFLGITNACQTTNSGNFNDCPSYSAGIAPQGNVVLEVGSVIAPQGVSCNLSLTSLGDDYQIGDGTGFVEVTFVRFLISVQSTARLAFAFWDSTGVPITDTILPNATGVSGPAIHTLEFDPPLILPASGFAGIIVAGNFTPAGSFSWLSIDDAVDVGTGDPTRMFANGTPTDGSSFNLGQCAGGVRDGLWCNAATGNIDCGGALCTDVSDNLAFEMVAVANAPDQAGACCDLATGACTSKLPWACKADGGTFQLVGTTCAACSNDFFQACTVDADCPACVGGTADGQACTGDVDCPQGTCTGTATCFLTPPGCFGTACCDPSGICEQTQGGLCSNDFSQCNNDLDCTAGGTCEAQCPPGATGSGFGSNCDPNACQQPIQTGGDNCFDVTVNQIIVPGQSEPPVTVTISGTNSTATFDDFNEGVCVDGAGGVAGVCDPDIGICTNLAACSVSAQDCADASTCQTDDAQCTASGGGECTRLCGNARYNPAGDNADPGWWESFQIDDCADIRIDFCTTDPVLQPAWMFLQAGCPCRATVGPSGALEPIGPRNATERSDGSGRGLPFCAGQNLWQTFRALPPGIYYYPVNSTPNGTFAVPPGGDYQFHITAGACRVAACCVNLCEGGSQDGQPCAPKTCRNGPTPGTECGADGDCGTGGTCDNGGVTSCPGIAANCVAGTCVGGALDGLPCDNLTGLVDQCPSGGVCGASGCTEVNEMLCDAANGFWLAGGDFPDNICDGGIGAGQECDTNSDCPGANCIPNNENLSCGAGGASPCDIGSCCNGPGECEDRDPKTGNPIRRIDCPAPRVFRGGSRCLFDPPPCPVCTVEAQGNCQEQNSAFAALMDRVNSTVGGVKVADDFIAGSPQIEQFCFKPAFFSLAPDGGFLDCADPNGQFGPPADAFEIRFYTDNNGFPGFLVHELAPANITAKAWTGGTATPQTTVWDYSIAFDPPLGGFIVGDKYWVEFSGAGNENCLVGIALSTDGNGLMLVEKDFIDPINQVWTFEDRKDSQNDVAFCIGGISTPSIIPPPPLTGACCQCKGICVDDVRWEECLGFTCLDNCPGGLPAGSVIDPLFTNGTFFPNQLCFDLNGGLGCLDRGSPGGCSGGTPQELEDCLLPLVVTDGSFTFNTTCSTTDGRSNFPEGSGCGAGSFVNDVWFEYRATCSGNVQFDLCGDSDFDVMYAVYSNGTSQCPTECPPPLNTLLGGRCNDAECPAEASAPSFEFFGAPDVCYTIRVGGEEGGAPGAFGTGRLSIDCQVDPCMVSSPPQLEQVASSGGGMTTSTKNRFLSFFAGDPGRSQAIRIRLLALPAPYGNCTVDDDGDGLGDTVLWVGQPFSVSELSGKDDATPPTFRAAGLECDLSSELFRDWSAQGTIHVFDKSIIPGATYDIQVLDSTCNEFIPTHFSDPVTVTNSRWGDVVGPFNSSAGVWSAPNGTVSVGGDVVAILDKFKSVPTAPIKARVDLQPRNLDFKIDINDVTIALDAFNGVQYPFSPSDGLCIICTGEPPQNSVCGNGIKEAGEECDDGNNISGDGCSSTCKNEMVADCGNGILESDEECDNGPDNSNTLPDACRTDCTLPTCGDNVIDPGRGETCDPPDGNLTCDANCRLVQPATAVISLVPVSASGNHSLDAAGSEITLNGGGQQVVLDLMVSGWDVDMDGLPTLRAWGTLIDSQGFSSGLQGVLSRANQACLTVQDCVNAFGGACDLTGEVCTQDSDCPDFGPLVPNPCVGALCAGAQCTPGFINQKRSDFVFSGLFVLGGVDLVGSDIRFGATTQNAQDAVTDPGEPLYLGTIVLDVPLDALGTFTVGPSMSLADTKLTDVDNALIPLAAIVPALITIVADACCEVGGSCSSPIDSAVCIAGGGTVIVECAGDNNSNGINDACEEVGCCVQGSCSLTTRAACKNMLGGSVCDCLGDNDGNGTDDACEACTVAATAPLAEDGGFGICTEDIDCPGITTCIDGVCYIPKNRYLGFRPNSPDSCTAMEVQLTEHRRCDLSGEICIGGVSCPAGETCGATDCEGTTWYVGDPETVVHNRQTFWISSLSPTPVFRNWSEPVIHVADLGIVPAARYSIRAIQESCFGDGTKFSTPLALSTTFSLDPQNVWGDVVGSTTSAPPDGQLNIEDLRAVLESYQGRNNSVPLPRADLMRIVPDRQLSMRDLLAVLGAISQLPYPGPSPCEVIPSAATGPDEVFAGPTPAMTCSVFDLAGNPAAVPLRVLPSQGSLVVEVFLTNPPEMGIYQAQFKVSASDRRGFCLGDSAIGCTEGSDCPVGICDKGLCDGGFLRVDDSVCCVSVVGDGCDRDWFDVDCSVSQQDCPDGSECISVEGACSNVGGACDGDPLSSCFGICAPEASIVCCEDPVEIDEDHTVDLPNGTTPDYLFDEVFALPVPNCAKLQFGASALGTTTGPMGVPTPYLGAFVVNISERAGGGRFNLVIEERDAQDRVVSELTLSMSSPSIPFNISSPCATFEVAFDCNLNECPDDCDIDSAACNTPQCQDFPGCVTACGNSNDCNSNAIPDECEIPVSSIATPPAPFTQFFCEPLCVGCPEACICSNTGEACPAACNCLTGDNCGTGCDATCTTGEVICDPDCNNNGIPDTCDLASCSISNPDCKDCNGNDILDSCDIADDPSLDCQSNRVPDSCEIIGCVDLVTCGDCDNDGLLNECEFDLNEKDCDGNGTCNACALSCVATVNGTLCSDLGTCGFNNDCQPNGIPDKCDIAANPDIDCESNKVPDFCDLRDCNGGIDPCCDDCNSNGILDSCDIDDCENAGGDLKLCDKNRNVIPDVCDISAGTSCDVIAPSGTPAPDDVPDETTLVCAAERFDCSNFHFPETPGTDAVASMGAALKIVWLDGTSTTIQSLTGPATISRRQLHFDGDALDTTADGEPCVIPGGFADLDTWRGREVHLKIETLSLSNGADTLTLGAEESLGEAQGTCADFPAETFFDLFLSVTVASPPAPLPTGLTLINPTPVIVQATSDVDPFSPSSFDWSFPTEASVFQSDTSAPAVPLIDGDGVHRGYLVSVRLGDGTLAADACDVAVGLTDSISFVVDGATDGILVNPPATTNHVKDDEEAGTALRTLRVYTALGAAPSGFLGSFVNTNARVDTLIGTTGGTTPFIPGDAINSLSFGRDGTKNTGAPSASPVLYYSVDNAAGGRTCGGVSLQAPSSGAPRNRTGGDIYMTDFKQFGDGEGPISPRCTSAHNGCLVADQTALGLGPFTIGPLGQEGSGLTDNLTALETSSFPGDRVYFTFAPAGGSPLGDDRATIYLFDRTTTPNLEFVNLRVFASLEQLGLQINDVIDALAVSDVGTTTCSTEPCAEPNTDSVLFSLAVNSPTLLNNNLSPADIFRSDLDGVTQTSAFATAEFLGLQPTDNIDAIDVGVALIDANNAGVTLVDVDCNKDAISDVCDIARGFDQGPNGIPDACDTICSLPPPATPMAETIIFGTTETEFRKNRYISFTAGEPGIKYAIRVTFKSLPAAFSFAKGRTMWVGEPKMVSELGITALSDNPPNFTAAQLQCTPAFVDWHGVCGCNEQCSGGAKKGAPCDVDSDCLGVINVYGKEIVPSTTRDLAPPDAVYEVQIVDQRCEPNSNSPESIFSGRLEIAMSLWGDAVGVTDPDTGKWGPPNGSPDVAGDVVAILDKFSNIPTAPKKSRVDLEPSILDHKINITDVVAALDGFQRVAYPFAGPNISGCP